MGEVKNKVVNHPVEGSIYGAGAFVILANMVGWDLSDAEAAAIIFAVPLGTAWAKRAWPYILKGIRQIREAVR